MRDLLKENSTNLTIVDDPVKGFIINDLEEQTISDLKVAQESLRVGYERRSMNATKTNDSSSRSHAIVQINIKRLMTSQDKVL